ncbi:MAG TPA: alpha/beta hydrolase [Acidimicrobiales bacterium]|nr:alpha/beta hydrolase [Acidimicrobiales bacterium]
MSIFELPRPIRMEVSSPAGAELSVTLWRAVPESRIASEVGESSVSRPGVLLVHGLASNSRMWDGVVYALFDMGYSVAAVDLRGHGQSSKPDQSYDFQTICVDLDHVLIALSEKDPGPWTRPIIAGQSWGANVVVEFAATRPWSVSGTVLVDGGTIELSKAFPEWEECERVLAPPVITGLTPEDLDARIRSVYPDWPETGIQGMLANFIVNADGFVEPCLSFERHMKILRHLWEHRPGVLFEKMMTPVLFAPAAGSNSAGPASDKQEEIAKAAALLAKSKVQWFNSDHDIHAQHPLELAQLIDSSYNDGFFD